ncbi:hypothetical protein [Cellulomonas sp. NPDC089187]|uniref:hypothetical protein n=1 Tax=Cellulomonas sp. NPDC089187 TaxID=3154970 RepID=UPI003438D6FD
MTSIEPQTRASRPAVTQDNPPDHRQDLPGTGANNQVGGIAWPPLTRHRWRRVIAWTAGVAVLALAVTVGVVLDQRARAAAAQAAMQGRAEVVDAAYAVDQEFFDHQREQQAAVTGAQARERALTEARTAAEQARALAVAAEHAGAENLAALRASADALEEALARLGSGASPVDLREVRVGTADAARVVQEQEDAWHAEQERLAAQRAAEQAAAEQAAAQRQQRSPAPPSSGGGGGGSAPSTGGWAPGVQAYGAAGLGAVLNQHRAAAGLPGLSVVGSSSLQNHAAAMAAAGSIWHSGRDHIVGWVQPINDGYMIQAYMDSPPHRAWILKSGVSRVAIGAVTINGVLYTAMVFS